MRGHITKRSSDSYTIVISLGTDPVTQKRQQHWESIKGTKKEAEKRLAELLHQHDNGNYTKPGKSTVAQFLERWLADYARAGIAPRSYERYEGIVRSYLIPSLGSISLVRLKPEHVQGLYGSALEKGLSAKSVNLLHSVLHVALKAAVRWGLVGRNVADAVDPPRIQRTEMRVWNEDEVTVFLDAAKDSPYYALYYTALFTGMRRSELLALKWKDVDLLLCQINVNRGLHRLADGKYIFTEPKSARSRRTIALSPSAIPVLRDHQERRKQDFIILGRTLSEEDLVFCRIDGLPLRPNNVTRTWKVVAKRCGLEPIRLHDARHTHATLMLKRNVHPKIVQERLGHASIQMTLDTYSHVAPGIQEAAAKAFDDLFDMNRNPIVLKGE